jgi:hypothetical protein
MTKKVDKLIREALKLIQDADGNVEYARGVWNDLFKATEYARDAWNDLFEAAEAIYDEQVNDGEDAWEIAVREQAERFEQAEQRRKNLKIVGEE